MRNQRILNSSLILFVLAFWVAGCTGSDRPDGLPELHSVVLEFNQAGTPLATASVRLIPQDTSNTWASGGTTDASGKAVLRTHGKFDGVPAGKYKVCVTKQEMSELQDMMPGGDSPEPPASAAGKNYDLVDPQYSSPSKTPLEIEVTAGSNSYEPFDLGEAVRTEKAGPPTGG